MPLTDLGPEANIMYASASIVDILGYHPHEVINRSCFDYFHPDEVPFARAIHNRGVVQDKAAVLHYARICGRDGRWVGCECVFTIVYNVLVACTSIYRGDMRNARE
jgi:PAS domain S-box-containing protein